MEEKDYEIIISTCGKFSDLWDANVLLLNKNWQDRDANTWLVTDDPTDRSLPGVQIVSAGSGTEITQRLAVALDKIEAEYVVLTLDDYFFTERIQPEKLRRVIRFMDEHRVAYTQLYPQPKAFLKKDGAREAEDYPGIYYVDLSEGNYKVVLTPGIWRTDFMRETLTGTMNAWQYEVSLTPRAKELGMICATSNCGELPYLDVIRKGKLLRKANRYFKKHPIYRSDRQVMKWRDECVLNVRTFLKFWMPKGVLRLMKRIMIKLGHSFYSPVS